MSEYRTNIYSLCGPHVGITVRKHRARVGVCPQLSFGELSKRDDGVVKATLSRVYLKMTV